MRLGYVPGHSWHSVFAKTIFAFNFQERVPALVSIDPLLIVLLHGWLNHYIHA